MRKTCAVLCTIAVKCRILHSESRKSLLKSREKSVVCYNSMPLLFKWVLVLYIQRCIHIYECVFACVCFLFLLIEPLGSVLPIRVLCFVTFCWFLVLVVFLVHFTNIFLEQPRVKLFAKEKQNTSQCGIALVLTQKETLPVWVCQDLQIFGKASRAT